MGRLDPIARWDIRASPPANAAPAVRPTPPFGSSGLSASFGRFGVTSPETGLHVLQPSMSPLATIRRQVVRRCPRSFTPWIAPQHVRVGAPRHQRVRQGRDFAAGTPIPTLTILFPVRVLKLEKVPGRTRFPPPVAPLRTFSAPRRALENRVISKALTEWAGYRLRR